jgi:hypothetical protein
VLNNITNFFNLIKTGKVKTQLDATDLLPIGTKDLRFSGQYQPTMIKYSDLVAGLISGSNGQVLYNNNGVASGAANFYWDATNNRILGGPTPTTSNFVIQKDITNDFIMYSPATYGGIQTFPTSGGANTVVNAKLSGTHGGYGNVAMGLGTVQADGSAFFGSTAIGQASYARGIYGLALGCEAKSGSAVTAPSAATAIGYNAQTTRNYSVALGYNSVAAIDNAIALGNSNALLQIGGNFTPLARVHINALGNTSATTSLLIQNTSSTELLRVRDDGRVYIGTTGYFIPTVQSTSLYNFYNKAIFTSTEASNIVKVLISNDTHSFLSSTGGTAGQIGINTNTPNISAALDITSTTTGVLFPRMTAAQRTAIATPAVGLMVYQTDATEGLYVYKSTGWALNS